MKAAFVRINGRGPISHTKSASMNAALIDATPIQSARTKNAAHGTNGSPLEIAIA